MTALKGDLLSDLLHPLPQGVPDETAESEIRK